ncbi:Si-specific NAD(P)(+) transhydrogenase [Leptospira ognonensis]|uniref:Soluble pyridine nucleotide transhydrogenase n=1 Tax=Leptospira ognonensis TaxID=2484945 RepID=A0A4V3JRA9_9LEPT|nr:Si-specific NAD(P)(+) transhydrogenase [Leptospira ognonensis]TGL59305.1 Si-specific NAD(P)(+) transhydrogenase [Leptospira ognonensis]
MKHYDLIVIGAGPAGEKAAAKASYFGKKVALVEMAIAPGGAGVHTGTLPSKTLKETALFLSGKNDKGIFGVDKDLSRHASIEDFYFRRNYVTNSEVNAIVKNISKHGIDFINGKAEFIGNHQVLIHGTSSETISADHILIATGSYPFRPSNIPFDGERIHDSDTILNLKRFPKSLCVLGAGVIGCEYTTIFATIGIPVYLVDSRDEILPFLDSEISSSLVQQMRSDRIEVIFNSELIKIEEPNELEDLYRIHLSTGEILKVDMFLFAAGRSGRTKGLGLESNGVKIGKREAIEVNEHYQSSLNYVYAVGDVIGFPALASTSMDQGRIAVTHMFDTAGFDRLAGIFPYGIYTIPEVSMVGISEKEAIAKGLEIETGKANYSDMPRGKILGAESGFLKLVFEKKSQIILGVHIIGLQATELIHFGLSLVESKKTLNQVISIAFNFPTLHDLYKYAAYDGLGNSSGHKIK